PLAEFVGIDNPASTGVEATFPDGLIDQILLRSGRRRGGFGGEGRRRLRTANDGLGRRRLAGRRPDWSGQGDICLAGRDVTPGRGRRHWAGQGNVRLFRRNLVLGGLGGTRRRRKLLVNQPGLNDRTDDFFRRRRRLGPGLFLRGPAFQPIG